MKKAQMEIENVLRDWFDRKFPKEDLFEKLPRIRERALKRGLTEDQWHKAVENSKPAWLQLIASRRQA